MFTGDLCRSYIAPLGLSVGLLGACSGADRPPRIGNPDLTPETPDAGDAGPARQDAGTSNHGAKIHYDYVGFGQVLTTEMMCEAPDAAPIAETPTHTCIWSTPRQIIDRPGVEDRLPALVATGNPAIPVGLSWTSNSQVLFKILDGQGADITNVVSLSTAIKPVQSRLAYDGTNFAVVWDDRTDPTSNIALKVDFRLVDGQGVAGQGVTVVDAGSRADRPVVSATDAGWLVLWGDGRAGSEGIYGSLLTPDGTISLGEQVMSLSGAVSILPSSTWTGSETAAVWHDNRDGNAEIYFGRFDDSLQLLEGSGQAITQREGISSEPTIITTDDGFAISWLDELCGSFRVHLTLLDREGNWLIPEQIFTRGGATAASVAWDEDHGLLGLLWVLGTAVNRELQFQLLDTEANRLSEVTTIASDVIDSIENPQLIWTPEGFMTVFENSPNGDRELYAATGSCTAL